MNAAWMKGFFTSYKLFSIKRRIFDSESSIYYIEDILNQYFIKK
jgi:hypothetical protein